MIIVLLITLALLIGFAVAAISGAPWVPVRKSDIAAIVDDLRLSERKLYIELGSGDGRVLAAVAKCGVQAVGYEINPLLWLIAWLRLLPARNARVKLANFWSRSLKPADVVMAFLIPRTMPRLEVKLKKEMRSGSLFISYVFPLPTKKPIQKHKKWYIYHY
jgi:hypothetical protein